jgi:hypothetical protein
MPKNNESMAFCDSCPYYSTQIRPNTFCAKRAIDNMQKGMGALIRQAGGVIDLEGGTIERDPNAPQGSGLEPAVYTCIESVSNGGKPIPLPKSE